MHKTRSWGFSPAHKKHKHLPHFDIKNHYQFITFRTYGSVDAYLKKLAQHNLPNKQKQHLIDEYLDRSTAGAVLNSEVLVLLNTFIKEHDSVLYELLAFCIMPNHVHLLIKPWVDLDKLMQKLKGGSAKLINDNLQTKGRFWAADYYDKLIRDEKHFSVVYRYIKNNPLVLGEAEASFPRFYGIYE